MWLYLPLAQVSRNVEQNVHTTFCFPNPLSDMKNCSLGDVLRFCFHFWCNLGVIFDQIINRSNFYLSLSRFWTSISLVIICQLPSISKSRIPPKNVCSIHSHKPFATILVFLLQINWLWNKILRQLCLHFCHPWHIKKNRFTRQVITHTLLKINKRNSVCEWMLVDST